MPLNNDEPSLRCFMEQCIDAQAALTSDGLASYNARSLRVRAHTMTCKARHNGVKPMRCKAATGPSPISNAAGSAPTTVRFTAKQACGQQPGH